MFTKYWPPFSSYCKSSSHLGTSKISANSGGNRIELQFCRNHSRWAKCLSPSMRSSWILASSAGMICNAAAALEPTAAPFERDRVI